MRSELLHNLNRANELAGTVRRRSLVGMAGLLSAAAGALCLVHEPLQATQASRCWTIMLLVGGISILIGWRVWCSPSPLDTARRIERLFPDLEHRLLTMLQSPATDTSGLRRLLESRILADLVAHARANDWRTIVSDRQRRSSAVLCCASLAGCLVVGAMAGPAPATLSVAATQASRPEPPLPPLEVDVQPGDAEYHRGDDVLFSAEFDHLPTLPVFVELQFDDGGEPQRLEMSPTLALTTLAARWPAIERPCRYRLLRGRQESESFSIAVYDPPQLTSINARLEFPEYANLPPAVVPDCRRVTVPAGTHVTLECLSNVPLAGLELPEASEGARIEAVGDGTSWLISLHATDDQVLKLLLRDRAGHTNSRAEEFQLTTLPNSRPKFVVDFPNRDVDVSPIEELHLEAAAEDDFALLDWGVCVTLDGQPEQTYSLNSRRRLESSPVTLQYLIELERLRVEPGQLLSYYFYAVDLSDAGEQRRTCSPMYFAEVRPFDEIFREAPQSGGAGQMQGAGGQTPEGLDQLLEQQKQIVQATWNLIRGDSESRQTSDDDLNVLSQSQIVVEEGLAGLRSRLDEPRQVQAAQAAAESMQSVVQTLKSELELPRRLADSLQHEQTAYRSLLKLRSSEQQVSQGQSGSGSGQGGGGRSQEQLQQLELKEQQRYETENAASRQAAGEAANSDQLRILNRLRELAQHQQSINDRLAELELELQLAVDEQTREELQRQLKRLRDRQSELLRDLDELKDRMDRSADRNDLAELRSRAEQTRSKAREASEALKQGRTADALGAGRHIENQLQQMSESMRQDLAHRFEKQIQQLQQQASRLIEEQAAVAEQLQQAEHSEGQRRSLRRDPRRDELAGRLSEQRDRVNELLDDVRSLVQESDTSEPVLSRSLYEAIRESRARDPQGALTEAAAQAGRGQWTDAAEHAGNAQAGIEQLRKDIDAAAAAVLGDQTASLRRARQQVRDALQELDDDSSAAQGGSGAAADKAGSAQTGPSPASAAGAREADRDKTHSPAANSDADSAESGPADSQLAADDSNPTANPANGGPASGSSQRDRSIPESGGQSENPSSGQPSSGQSSSGQSSSGQSSSGQSSSGQPSSGQPSSGQGQSSALAGGGLSSGPGGGPGSALTGTGFQEWSDRLREVEELVEDSELRTRARQIREQARSMRADFVRHSRRPDPDALRQSIVEPLAELERELDREIRRRQQSDDQPPIDRDPVPRMYSEIVRRYYEQLGSEQRPSEQRASEQRGAEQ